jgi:hypothetical protein
MEWSFNIETEVFIEFSLLWLFWHFISVDDVELLVESSMLLVDDDVLALLVFSLPYIQNLSTFIDEESIIVLEHLPPSRVDSTGHSHVVAVTI